MQKYLCIIALFLTACYSGVADSKGVCVVLRSETGELLEIQEQLLFEQVGDGSPRVRVTFLGQRDALVGFFKRHGGEKVSVFIDGTEISCQRVGSAALFGRSDASKSKSFTLVIIPKDPASFYTVIKKYRVMNGPIGEPR